MFGWTARLLATMAITLRATVRNDQPDLGPAASAAGSPACRLHRARSGKSAKASTMSPEQAKGHPADKRSDVWSFGAVLHEMLSGQRTFKGDDIADTMAAVLRQDVDWTALPAPTPQSVRYLLARCLERDIKRRLRDIREARIVLDHPAGPVMST